MSIIYTKTNPLLRSKSKTIENMSITLNLRFQKSDAYSTQIFLAAEDRPEEIAACQTLSNFAKKIDSLNLGTFSPIYHNTEHNYSSIRFKFYNLAQKLNPRDLYTVKFTIRKSERDGKKFMNCS